ncbi:MAG: hypothetical protein Q7U85_02145 [Rhodocyclaceae bacterium]|nr:hypothetical protein [Rhodocyclaceae bacterium]
MTGRDTSPQRDITRTERIPVVAHYAGLRIALRHQVPVLATYHTHFEEYIAHYLPALPRPWLKAAARKIAAADVFAFAFASRTETQGLVLLEAMAAEASDYELEWAAPLRARQLAGLYRSLVASIT